jgi:SOS response regulatory protein OraA/RecX
MFTKKRPGSGQKRIPRPLTAARLEELALAYVARFATSAAKLEDYLRRKLRERGWEGEDEAPVAALVARYVEAGFVDDLAYARAKSGSLLRRGYGQRRIGQALNAAGIAEDVREEVRPDAAAERRAALAMAQNASSGRSDRRRLIVRPAKSRSPRCFVPGTGWTAPVNWSIPPAKPPRWNGRLAKMGTIDA